jgi:23S rRNA (pseudouridine1915-N3)-methyltransferase
MICSGKKTKLLSKFSTKLKKNYAKLSKFEPQRKINERIYSISYIISITNKNIPVKTVFIMTGKTNDAYLREGMAIYENRLRHYITFDTKVIPDIKKIQGISAQQQQLKEGKLLMNSITPGDTVILLDERGKELKSVDFARFLQKLMLQSNKSIVFVAGGAYGFSKELYDRANEMIALSRMTFSHQMVRLIFLEQLYRAMTILKNEPYHH